MKINFNIDESVDPQVTCNFIFQPQMLAVSPEIHICHLFNLFINLIYLF